MRIKKKVIQKIISVFSTLILLANSFSPYLLIAPVLNQVKAEDPAITQTQDSTPTPTIEMASPTPTAEPTLAPTGTPIPTPTSGPKPTVAPIEKICLTDNKEIKETINDDWEINKDLSQTKKPVKLGVKYIFPQENKVSVTFKCLPKDESLRKSLKIEQIKVSDLKLPDEMKPATEYAYDITTDMQDGSFEYDITLPKNSGQTADVSYIEKSIDEVKTIEVNTDEIKQIEDSKVNQGGDKVKASSIDHFTIFVVTVIVLQPSYATPGGGGVYSAYYGPPSHSAISPGFTSIYDGREAGIIKAGQGTNPGSSNWDEGLFAFKPTVTIDTFATSPVTYDVQNEAGVNPVWMTIEIDTGIINDRSDNITYQFVPTSNPAGWHTVDAATGSWQKWNDGAGDTTGNPLLSLSAVATAHTGLNVVRAYLRLGMGDSYYNGGTGTIAWVDKTTFGGETYDFSITSVTTNDATGITSNNATLNGFNKSDATGHSFWVSLAPFVTTSSTIPAGVYSSPDLGSIAANTDFSVSLSSITTTGVPSNLPAITPGTTYYFAAWSSVGGTWYPGEIKTFTTANGPVFIDTNINGILDSGELSFYTIQAAISAATSGNTIHVTAGTYTEVGQIVINKNLTIIGADKTTTIIKPSSDTVGSGDAGSWILVNDGITLNLSNVTLDGVGRQIRQGIRLNGNGVIDNIIVQNIVQTGYMGFAIVQGYNNTGSRTLAVTNSTFTNFGRVGIQTDNGTGSSTATISNNIFTGKGDGDHLDYAIAVEGGSIATITNNTISNCRGVASTDGSTSAGISATTYFAEGTTASITGNTITNSTYGIAVGYGGSDTTSVSQFDTNTFSNNDYDLDNHTIKNIDARNNTWSVTDQDSLNQIEAKINHYCSGSVYVHGTCSGTDDYSTGFGMVRYKDIGIPTNSGWNLQSKSPTPNETPLDLACSTSTVYTNENSLAQNWTVVNGTNIKYQREVTFPSNAISNIEAGSNIYTPFSSFGSGPGTEGLWKTRVRAYVDANNNNIYDFGEEVSGWSNECQITFDKTAPPVPTHISPANGAFKTTASLTSVDWSDVIDTNGPVSYYYQSSLSSAINPDGSFVTPAYTSGALATSNISAGGTPQNTYYWHVRAKDVPGNLSAWSSAWSIIVDNTAPSSDPSGFSSSPAISTPSNDQTVTVSWTTGGVDALSGVDGYSYSFTNESTDVPDNIKDIEETATNVTSPTLADGTWYFHIRTVDNAGNWTSTAHYGPFTIETVLPTLTPVSIVSDNSNLLYAKTGNKITLTFTSSETVSTPLVYILGQSATVSNLGGNNWQAVYTTTGIETEGIVPITIDFTDTAGNNGVQVTTTTDASIVTYDNTNPTNPGTPSTTTPTNSTTQGWSWAAAVDTISGILRYAWRVGGGGPSGTVLGTSTTATTNLLEGIWNFFVKAIDNAGNESAESEGTVTVDTTPPSAPTPLTPGDIDAIKGIAFDQTWTNESASGAVLYGYQSCYSNPGDAGGSCGSVKSTSTYSGTTKHVGAGQPNSHFWWRVRAKDTAGNWSNYGSAFELIIDNSAPNISLNAPTSPTNDTTPSFTGTSSDVYDAGVNLVEYQVDSGSWTLATGTNSFSFTTGVLTPGAHTVSARATDRAGNISSSSSQSITIDTTEPNISADNSSASWRTANITITLSVSDTGGQV